MPLTCPDGSKPRYRWVTRGGKKIRLAFCGKKEVIEVKKKGGKAKRVKKSSKKKRKGKRKKKSSSMRKMIKKNL